MSEIIPESSPEFSSESFLSFKSENHSYEELWRPLDLAQIFTSMQLKDFDFLILNCLRDLKADIAYDTWEWFTFTEGKGWNPLHPNIRSDSSKKAIKITQHLTDIVENFLIFLSVPQMNAFDQKFLSRLRKYARSFIEPTNNPTKLKQIVGLLEVYLNIDMDADPLIFGLSDGQLLHLDDVAHVAARGLSAGETFSIPSPDLDIRGSLVSKHLGLDAIDLQTITYYPTSDSLPPSHLKSYLTDITATSSTAKDNSPDRFAFIQSMIGSLFWARVPKNRNEIIFNLTGVGGAGKGTLIKLLHRFFGTYCISLTVKDFTVGNRFSSLHFNESQGAVMAYVDEVGENIRLDGGRLNNFASKEPTEFEVKGVTGSSIIPTAQLFLISNDPLNFRGSREGLERRLQTYSFNRSKFHNGKKAQGHADLLTIFTTEERTLVKDFIFSSAIEFQRNGLNLDASERIEAPRETFEEFMLLCFTPNEGCSIIIPHFNHIWKLYVEHKGLRLSDFKFKSGVKIKKIAGFSEVFSQDRTAVSRIYRGLKLHPVLEQRLELALKLGNPQNPYGDFHKFDFDSLEN